jgi:predicted acylesterase/phospholipase RssA
MSASRQSGQPFSSLQLSGIFRRRQKRENSAGSISSNSERKHGESSTRAPPTPSFARRRAESNDSTLQTNKSKRRGSHFSILSPRGFYQGEEKTELHPLLTETYHNEEDINAFADALQDDAGQHDALAVTSTLPVISALSRLGYSSSNQAKSTERSEMNPEHHSVTQRDEKGQPHDPDADQTATRPSNPRKVGRIAAASDFAPVRERTKRRGRGSKIDSGSREGLVYIFLRFPLLVGIFLTIALEFAAYVLIRQIVNVVEYSVAWRGRRGTLRKRMRKANDAAEWRTVALELDQYQGYENWKREDASGLYDWILVKKVLYSLQTMRENDDADGVMGVLELCLRNNFAGTENFRLYSETFFGTKYLIESYLCEVEEALAYIQHTKKVSPQKKRSFYRGVQKNMGRSALCLSGGGSFGYYHFGLVKTLLDANLLPAIISGTSAGGLIAALTCTRTNEELKVLLVPELADRITACEESIRIWGARAYRTGARFDTVKWAEKAQFFTRGSMTFAEAYARTGKVLNISVIPADRHSPVKLLNYHTAPNCIIWSSLLASSAVPGILNPVCLMQKDKNGHAVPWNWGHRFKDGSLRVDIPLQDLHALFNVNYPIVSQVNPHVHLFFFAPKGNPGRPVAHRKGKGWRGGFILSASEHVLKLHLSMNFKIIRDLDLLPSILGQDWSTVFLQQFGGAVTIWPKTRAWDWVRILSDPDRKELDRMIKVGQGVTFPKLHMIENRVRLERAIESGRKTTRQALKAISSAKGDTQSGNNGKASTSGRADSATDENINDDAKQSMATPSAPVSANGPATQSDTDATTDDFFSAKKSSNSRSSNVKMRGQLKRLQGLRGLSSLNGDTPAFTPDEGGEANGGTATPLTPGELPRHIRSRSMGLDEDDEEDAAEGNRNNGSNNNWSSRSMRWLNDRDKAGAGSSSSSSSDQGND